MPGPLAFHFDFISPYLAAMQGDEAATLLRESVQASLHAGVFGSPTVVVDGEPFCGLDQLGEVDEWLSRGGW